MAPGCVGLAPPSWLAGAPEPICCEAGPSCWSARDHLAVTVHLTHLRHPGLVEGGTAFAARLSRPGDSQAARMLELAVAMASEPAVAG